MLAVHPTRLREVLVVAEAHAERLTSLDECVWGEPDEVSLDAKRRILDGLPLFVKGTCAQYVDYLYRGANLEIVAISTRENAASKRIFPSTQLHAFWTGTYPLQAAWCAELATYPECIKIGSRSTQR